MTAKFLDILYNDYPTFEFGALKVLALGCGDPAVPEMYKRYDVQSQPDPMKIMASPALVRNMVRCFRLLDNGELILEKLTYPVDKWAGADEANEQITGDFWLELTSPRVKKYRRLELLVPFYNGVICSDMNQWYLRERKVGLLRLSDEEQSFFVRSRGPR